MWLYSANIGGRANGITMVSATASAAPELIPSNPGSASGLRNNPCITAPELASAQPTTTASNTRGRRTVSQTCHKPSLSGKPISVRSERDIAPVFAARMASNSRAPPRPVSAQTGERRRDGIGGLMLLISRFPLPDEVAPSLPEFAIQSQAATYHPAPERACFYPLASSPRPVISTPDPYHPGF